MAGQPDERLGFERPDRCMVVRVIDGRVWIVGHIDWPESMAVQFAEARRLSSEGCAAELLSRLTSSLPLLPLDAPIDCGPADWRDDD